MERLVGTLRSTTHIAKNLDSCQSDNDLTHSMPLAYPRPHNSQSHSIYSSTPSTLVLAPPTPRSPDGSGSRSDEEEDESDKELADGMRKLSMQSQPFRYHGKSSGLVIIRTAMALKNTYAGSPPAPLSDAHHPWLKAFVEDDFPVFGESSFPPSDLLGVLVDLYFRHMSCHYPLLHEPTFKNSVAAGEHLRHGPFGATVLLVCAIGSRFTRDPRVLLDGSDHPHSAGWKWFNLVEGVRRLSFAPAKLHTLQVYALMALFLHGSTAPQYTWSAIGAGIRAAIDVGAHRRKMYASTPTVEEELWRRAFWVLVFMEWWMGHGLGRPSSIHDEDFDLALPTECDDEYWLTPEGEPLFKQPPGKPSKVTAFVYMIRLGQILAFVMRTVYSSNKSKAQLGHSDQQWEQRIVAELDSGLNKWADSLPSHLRWKPEQEDVVFLTQAATLSVFYYFCQLAVHRDFLSSRRESALSLPSDIICTNAARSAIQGMLFLSGMVLMTNALGLKRSGRVVNVEKDVVLGGRAVEMMRSLRYESQVSGSLAEVLNDLVFALNEPLPSRARTSATNARRASADKTEINRPSSPAALEPEIPLREQRTEDSNASSLPTSHEASNAPDGGRSFSFAPSKSLSSGATVHIPPGLDFLQPDPPLFSPPFVGSDSLVPNAQAFSAPFDNLTTQSAEDHVRPPSALPRVEAHEYKYNFLPRYDLQHAQSRTYRSVGTTDHGVRGQHQFDIAGEPHMFPPPTEVPLGYTGSASVTVTPPSVPSGSQVDLDTYSQLHRHLTSMPTGAEYGGGHTDVGTMPRFGLMDDAQGMWPHFPPRADWGV
ncbi:transcription factor [Ganoderma sinense ZZ0214-1]|uniref:Transcription factor n=1 Tax=Ganoderma sinense ZZ0214-1 TaxID=1077348 RepID=A0A2G8RV46_9APHY|nr:transcription factor [Ganoderma sinense ZZ0214-1]